MTRAEQAAVASCVVAFFYVTARALVIGYARFEPRRAVSALRAASVSVVDERRRDLLRDAYRSALGPARLLPVLAAGQAGVLGVTSLFGFHGGWHIDSQYSRGTMLARAFSDACSQVAVAIALFLVLVLTYALASALVLRGFDLPLRLSMEGVAYREGREAWQGTFAVCAAALTSFFCVLAMILSGNVVFNPGVEALPVTIARCEGTDVALDVDDRGVLSAHDARSARAIIDRGYVVRPESSVCLVVSDEISYGHLVRVVDGLRGRGASVRLSSD
jgi:hypothetical protein